MIGYKPQAFITGINIVNCCVNCLVLWEKEVLRVSNKTVSSLCSQTLGVLPWPGLPPSLCLVLVLLVNEGRKWCSAPALYRRVMHSRDLYDRRSKAYTLMNFQWSYLMSWHLHSYVTFSCCFPVTGLFLVQAATILTPRHFFFFALVLKSYKIYECLLFYPVVLPRLLETLKNITII